MTVYIVFVSFFPSLPPSLFLLLSLSSSLFLQDFAYLSEGLEGRSTNPVSLLFDTLFHPNADIGETHASSLRWERDDASSVSHIVIGREKPGGVWHGVEPSTLTLSHQDWLDLPLYSFAKWKKKRRRGEGEKEACRNEKDSKWRARAGHVAQYYQAYVQEVSLQENFLSHVTIEKAEQMWDCPFSPRATTPTSSLMTTPLPLSPVMTSPVIISEGVVTHCPRCSCDKGVSCPNIIQADPGWMLQGTYQWPLCCKRRSNEDQLATPTLSGPPTTLITVRARKLVLACGLTEPKRLGVPGEDLPFVLHSLSDFKTRLQSVKVGGDKSALVVGAGMSAADAILFCLDYGIHVYHSFYQDLTSVNGLILSKLPNGYYQEYQRVWRLMRGVETTPLYTPLKATRVVKFSPNETNLRACSDGTETGVAASVAMVAIGNQASLDFLPEDINSTLAIDPSRPIDSKNNSIDVDPFTSQSEKVPNLYALGPLAGDNFVRFLFGSGFACAKSIQKSTTAKIKSTPAE